MEERINLLEAKLTVAQDTINKLDQSLGIVFQYFMLNKAFFDGLQIKKPNEEPKAEAK